MAKKFYGVVPPIVTPIDENEKVDEKALRKLIRHCIEVGIPGIFVCGSNGECMALTQKERDRAIQITLDECGDEVPVMAGVMDSSTIRVIENVKRLEQMGGTTAVVTPVFYARHATQNETVIHFDEISKHTEADLFIYNIPTFTGQRLTADTIIELSKIDKVVGVKDTSGNFPDFVKMLRYFKGSDFMVFQGATNLAGPSVLLGADGYVPSLAPLFPKPHLELYNTAKNGDIEGMMHWAEIVDNVCKLYGMAKSQTSSTKYGMSKLGFMRPDPLRPTEPITASEMAAIDAHLEKYREYI